MNKILLFGLYVMTILKKSFQSTLSFIKIILLSKPITQLPVSINEKCSLLGNGPSLNESIEQHLEFLQSTEMVCLNTFATTDYYLLLKPENYVLLDPAFFSEEGSKRDVIISTYKSLIEKTTWTLNLYVPTSNKKSILLKKLLSTKKNINIVYFNYTIFEGFDFLRKIVFSKGLASPQCENVMVAALFLMINRNFKEIFLYGADHSWHEQIRIREDNVITIKDLHFYNSDAEKEKDLILINSKLKQRKTIAEQFLSFSKAFRGYEILATYARFKNVRIYNASAKSYIDAFERIKI